MHYNYTAYLACVIMRICKHISISDSVSLTNTTTTTTTAGHFHFCPSTAIFLCSDFFRPVRLAFLFLLFCAPKSPPWTQTLMDTWTATKEQKICCPSQSICRNICPSFFSSSSADCRCRRLRRHCWSTSAGTDACLFMYYTRTLSLLLLLLFVLTLTF